MTASLQDFARYFAVALVASAMGLAIATSDVSGRSVTLVAATAALPLIGVATYFRPVEAFAAFLAVQPLEAFEFDTGVGTLSPGIAILAALVVTRARVFSRMLLRSTTLRAVSTLAVVWWLYLLPSHYPYEGLSQSLRLLVTTASFLAVGMVAATLPVELRTLRIIAVGAALALVGLGIAGTLVSLGYLPPPQRISMARELLGIIPPFERNYGLNVPFDTVALLAPPCLGLLAFSLFKKGIFPRSLSLFFLALIAGSVLLVFQARGIALQFLVGLVLAVALSARRLIFVLLPVGLGVIWVSFVPLAQVDEVSTGLRGEVIRLVTERLTSDPVYFLGGHSENDFYIEAAERAGYLAAISTEEGANVVHNLFLSNLVGGGIVAFLLIGAIYGLVGVSAWKAWAANRDAVSGVLLVSFALVLLAVSIEPVRANIAGSWTVIGLVLANAATRESRKAP